MRLDAFARRRTATTLLFCGALAALTACGDDSESAVDGDGVEEDGGDEPIDDVRDEPLEVQGRFPSFTPEGFELHDLGEMAVVDGETADITFEADGETRGFYLIGAAHPDTHVVILRLVGPDGVEIIHPHAEVSDLTHSYLAGFEGPSTSPNATVARPGAAAVLVPNTPAISMQAGTWTARVGVFAVNYDEEAELYDNEGIEGRVRVGIMERREDAPARATLDLALSFSPGCGVTAEDAPSTESVQQLLAQARSTLAQADIEIGAITYEDAPDLSDTIDLEPFACLGGESLVEALEAAPPLPRPGIRLLFIDRFSCARSEYFDSGDGLVGISNGVPGIPGATHDGVVIATLLSDAYREPWTRVAVHEIGHYLGLFHTCDAPQVEVCDAIEDTSETAPQDNIMYFDIQQASDTLSPQQSQVLRTSAALRATD